MSVQMIKDAKPLGQMISWLGAPGESALQAYVMHMARRLFAHGDVHEYVHIRISGTPRQLLKTLPFFA